MIGLQSYCMHAKIRHVIKRLNARWNEHLTKV